MARRMEPKNAEDLALDNKLDIARTIITLRKRIEARAEKNELEAIVKRAHAEEVNNGTVSLPQVPSTEDLAVWLTGANALPAGDDSSS